MLHAAAVDSQSRRVIGSTGGYSLAKNRGEMTGESPGGDDGKKLRDFFLQLADDPEGLYKKYLLHPREVMADKLPQNVIDAVMAGNLKELNRIVKGPGKDIICGTIVRG
jgi:hypothetical protein